MKPFVSLGPPSRALLTRRAGYRPLGAVNGVSVVQTTMNQTVSGLDGTELKWRSEAVRQAVDGARSRAVEQATSLGANAVVGVGLDVEVREETPSSPAMIVARCVGTAVAEEDGPKTPFLTNLDGEELLALRAAGYAPMGLAVGFAFYSQISGYRTHERAGAEERLGIQPLRAPRFHARGLRGPFDRDGADRRGGAGGEGRGRPGNRPEARDPHCWRLADRHRRAGKPRAARPVVSQPDPRTCYRPIHRRFEKP